MLKLHMKPVAIYATAILSTQTMSLTVNHRVQRAPTLPSPPARLSKYFNSGSAPSNRCGDCSDDDGGQDPPCQPAARHVSSTAGPRSDALTPSAFEFPASEFCITADEDEEKEDNKGTYQMRKESSFKNDLTLCRSLHPSIHNSCCTKIGCLYISLGHVWRLLLLAHPAVTRGRL